jgi:alginate O-acetyltransferase complex protein AlgI
VLFTTIEFFVFLAVVLVIYYGPIKTFAGQRTWIILASAAFYAFWSLPFLFHFVAIVTVNYYAGEWLAGTRNARRRRQILAAAISLDLANLVVFKYATLAAVTMNQVIGFVNAGASLLPMPQIVLPLAVSFYTFHVISYLVDVSHGKEHARAACLSDFLFYVMLFPHQIAGPILRGHELFPQLCYKPLHWREHLQCGGERLIIGLFQKALIADNLEIIVDHGYANPMALSGLESYVVLVAYSFQIFFDFAGYSNMGIGVALMLGYRLPENFATPYLSANIAEFWRRWHMTLSRWIRDYIYIPLGGSRGSKGRTVANVMATMGLAGLWHGASWSFALWGLLHGAALVINRAFSGLAQADHAASTDQGQLRRLAGVFITFHFVTLAWAFFRAPRFDVALTMLQRVALLVTAPFDQSLDQAYLLKSYGFTGMLVYGIAIAAWRVPKVRQIMDGSIRRTLLVLTAMILLTIVFAPESAEPFIYFQF